MLNGRKQRYVPDKALSGTSKPFVCELQCCQIFLFNITLLFQCFEMTSEWCLVETGGGVGSKLVACMQMDGSRHESLFPAVHLGCFCSVCCNEVSSLLMRSFIAKSAFHLFVGLCLGEEQLCEKSFCILS